MKKLCTVLFAILVLTAMAQADIYIKSKTHSDAFSIMGQSQPEKNDVAEQWIGDEMFANLTKDVAFVMNLKKNLMYIINHGEKTYLESGIPLDMSKILPPEMAQMAGSLMKMTVKVAPNGQTKKVGQWNCTGYEATISMMMMPMKMTIWASTDVPFDLDNYQEKVYGNVLKAQMMMDDAALAEMKKVKGLWIATQMTMEMMGAKMNTTTEVTEISKKTPDASVYAVPAGYKKTDKLSAASLQKR
jgi:Holliday junction resolvase RusA-like endonuclease